MCVCVYACVHLCVCGMRVFFHACMYATVHLCVCGCVCVWVRACISACVYKCYSHILHQYCIKFNEKINHIIYSIFINIQKINIF